MTESSSLPVEPQDNPLLRALQELQFRLETSQTDQARIVAERDRRHEREITKTIETERQRTSLITLALAQLAQMTTGELETRATTSGHVFSCPFAQFELDFIVGNMAILKVTPLNSTMKSRTYALDQDGIPPVVELEIHRLLGFRTVPSRRLTKFSIAIAGMMSCGDPSCLNCIIRRHLGL